MLLVHIAVCLAVLVGAWSGPVSADAQPSSDCIATNRRQATNAQAKCFATDIQGKRRTFRLYMPATRREPLPLVLVLHGGGGSGGNMEWLTERGFNRIADRDGVVIAYPDGIGKSWNDGRTDFSTNAASDRVDDVGFLSALPRRITTLVPIDVTRVYATGMSNGGLMSHRLGCDAADVFAAVAPVAANLSVDLATRCRPARPISIAIVNGTDDPIMPWAGGTVQVLWMARGRVISTPATLARWLELDACAPVARRMRSDDVADDGTVLEQQSAACKDGTEVNLLAVRGGGHTWPSGHTYLGERLVGRVSREVDASDAIWRFFQRHRLPRTSTAH